MARPLNRTKELIHTALEAMEPRRLLSVAQEKPLEATHMIGCCCAMCGSGAAGFYEEPLTAAEKRALHGSRETPEILLPNPPIAPMGMMPSSSPEAPITPGAPVGSQPVGALTGKIVYTHAGHGSTSDNLGDGNFDTQRGENFEIVEDFGNQDQMTAYVNYLFESGATIVPLRPVGYQPNEVVVDNTSAGFSVQSGSWSNGSSNPYFALDNSVQVRYRAATSSATETAVARFTPNIPVAGFYPVYGWALNGANRLPDQTFRVVHTGGATEVKVNLQRTGKGWIYLGTYFFNSGTAGFVEVSNKTSDPSPNTHAAIADAIRFGNGLGDIDRGNGISGLSREDEAGIYWMMKMAGYEQNGSTVTPVSDSNWRSSSEDRTATVGSSPRYATYMNDSAQGALSDRVFLSYHSNAGGGRGTVGLYNGNNNPATATPNQFEWAQFTGEEVNNDMVALSPQLEHTWFNRSNPTLDRSDIEFGEINNTYINDEFDATIVEVAFHDDQQDAELMRSPVVRNYVARATVQATVKYFNFVGATPINLAPDAPTKVRVTVNAAGDMTLNWTPPVVDGIGGDAATGYRIYSSVDGYGFDGGITVAGGATTSYTIPSSLLNSNEYFFKVVSTNAGGESPGSPVVAARKHPGATPKVLIVNGFDRFSRSQDFRQTVDIIDTNINNVVNPVTIDRVRPRFSNSFDYTAQAGRAIAAYSTQLGFDSCQNENVIDGSVNLSNYQAVIWMSGEESTEDDSFNATEQTLVSSYVGGGGKLFVSGSEVGWDLVANNGGASFFNNTLHSTYVNDDAGTYGATGNAGSIFAGISLSFDNGAQFYDAEYPDTLAAPAGSVLAMNYTGGGGAATTYTSGAQRVVMMGFPFETITTSANRNAVMNAVLTFFNFNSVTSATPAAPDLLAASDTGTSSSDNITNLNNSSTAKTLQFTVGGTVAGATVTVYADGTPIGSAVASGPSTTVTTNGTSALSEGNHAFTATQLEPGKTMSPASGPLAVSIDSIAPTVNTSVFNYLTSQYLVFTFSEDVGATLTKSDQLLENLTIPAVIPEANIVMSYLAPTRTATFTFPGYASGILPDGNYRSTLLAAGITDTAGNTLPANSLFQFFVLAGDANRDRTVSGADFNILATHFGAVSGVDFSKADFNYSGTVNSADFNILASNFGRTLPGESARGASGGSSSLFGRGAGNSDDDDDTLWL